MQILNATRSVKSILTDRSELITILPGQASKVTIASKNLITAAIKLGPPSEIGIIISGGYEMDVAKVITGAIPYLYTSLDEAKAKLIDPSINYTGTLNAGVSNLKYEEELKAKDNLINELKGKIETLTTDLDEAHKPSPRVTELEVKLAELESQYRTLSSDKLRLASQLAESEDQVKNLTEDKNKLREQIGTMSQDLAAANKTISQYNEVQQVPPTESTEYLELKSQYDKLKSSMENNEDAIVSKNQEIQNLQDSLADAVNKIESMKSTFNDACRKFNLYLDENGEWQQEVSE